MSDTDSFVDPVFLARFGLSRVNVIDYFLHPLNPFRTLANTSNEVLAMQGICIGTLLQQGMMATVAATAGAGGVGKLMTPQQAEEEYEKALRQNHPGEQYELLPPDDPILYVQPSPLYTIRHVFRTTATSVKVLGIYYVVEGVIYKAPSVRSLMKANVARTLEGLGAAAQQLSVCARFQPSTGYIWHFEAALEQKKKKAATTSLDEEDEDEEDDDLDPVALRNLFSRRKRRKILDHRRPGERTAAEEEGIRASEAMDRILVRLSQSTVVKGGNSNTAALAASSK